MSIPGVTDHQKLLLYKPRLWLRIQHAAKVQWYCSNGYVSDRQTGNDQALVINHSARSEFDLVADNLQGLILQVLEWQLKCIAYQNLSSLC